MRDTPPYALGAKPPPDPVEELANAVWPHVELALMAEFPHMPLANRPLRRVLEICSRYVLDHAKDLNGE